MSGRKRGEVLAVLKNAFSNRKDIFSTLLVTVDNGLNTLKSIEIGNKDYKDLKSQKDTIEAELKRVDKEIQKIENAIKQSDNGWYLDKEYDEAKKLLSKYKTIKSNLSNLLTTIDQATIKHQTENKTKAKSAIEAIENILNAEYLDITDNSKKDIFNWCDKYYKSSNSDSLKKELVNLQQNYSKGDYNSIISKNNAIYTKAKKLREEVDELSIQLLETREIAISFKDSIDKGYGANIQLIDGDISKGLIVKTKKDDFFVEVPLGANKEEIVLNMPNDGTCKDSAKSIQENLKKIGIDFNVTYWGDDGAKTITKTITKTKAR